MHGIVMREWPYKVRGMVVYLCPIHKKGDVLECRNCRGISLLPCMNKILWILYKKMLPFGKRKIGIYQACFMGKSTKDLIVFQSGPF